jgi:hypothetical protein
MSTARAMTVIDDQQVRVTTWTFDGAGDATGPHVHEYDYIVVPVTGGSSPSSIRTAPPVRWHKKPGLRIAALPEPRTTSSTPPAHAPFS